MAIDVRIQCSECGTVTDKRLHGDETEIICPDCYRNSDPVQPEDFREATKTLSGQRLMGIVALVFAVGAVVLLTLYAGQPATWVSTDNPAYIKRLEKDGLTRNADTSTFLYGAGGCILLCTIFGVLASRRRYVVEF